MEDTNIFFLGSKGNIALSVAQHLCSSQPADCTSADLSDTLLILPGRQALRSVRNELSGLFPFLLLPAFATPGTFCNMGIPASGNMPSSAEKKLLWMEVLDEIDAEEFPVLFPGGLIRNDQTLSAVADQLLALKRELESGRCSLTIRKADEMLQNADRNFPELALLEDRYHGKLEEYGLADLSRILIPPEEEAVFFLSYRRIVIAACPDLPPFVKEKIQRLEQAFKTLASCGTAVPEVEICITAGKEWSDHFDSYGCVIPEAWQNVGLPLKPGLIHSVPDVGEMAHLAARLALTEKEVSNGGNDPDDAAKTVYLDCGNTSVVTTHGSFFPELVKAFSALRNEKGEPLALYDPDGVSMKRLRLVEFCRLLSLLMEGDQLKAEPVRRLLRQECVLGYFAEKYSLKKDDLLKSVDVYYSVRLPEVITERDLPDGGTFFPYCYAQYRNKEDAVHQLKILSDIFRELLLIRERLLVPGKLLENLRKICMCIFCAESYPARLGISFEDECAFFRKACASLEKSQVFAKTENERALRIFSDMLSEGVMYAEHPSDALEVTGFLDMPFREAGKIVLCGMSEGLLPERSEVSAYLNDDLRKQLSLPDNSTKYARDCFYVKLLLDKTSNNVHFISPKCALDGSLLPFSSFYFAALRDFRELLKRCSVLFGSYAPLRKSYSGREMPFTGEVDLTKAFREGDCTVINVTAFSKLLESPLSAFLTYSEDIGETAYDFPELDAADQGTIIHAALQRFDLQQEWVENFHSEDPVRKSQAVESAFEGLQTLFLEEVRCRCGMDMSLFVRVQTERWRLRLHKTAEKLLESSCRVLAREWKLCSGKGVLWEEGVYIKGTIDRIEYDTQKKELRLIDFKTGSASDPEKAHIQGKHFKNLQLPLYKLLLRKDDSFQKAFPEIDLGSVPIRCGYFSISRVIGDIGYHFWDTMDIYEEDVLQAVSDVLDRVKYMQKGFLQENLKKYSQYDPCRKIFPYGYKETFGNTLQLVPVPSPVLVGRKVENGQDGSKSPSSRRKKQSGKEQ